MQVRRSFAISVYKSLTFNKFVIFSLYTIQNPWSKPLQNL